MEPLPEQGSMNRLGLNRSSVRATKSSQHPGLKSSYPLNKLPTTIMMQEALKALSTKFRRGFSLDKIRKYILEHYLLTANQLKHRVPLMKKFFKKALKRGDIVSVKGVGLRGSFQVLPTSPLHKNAKRKKTIINQEEEDSKKMAKNKEIAPKVSEVKRIFSANV